MLGLTLEKILELISHYGYAVIFPVSIVEGPMVAVITGLLVSIGRLNWLVSFLVLMSGDLVGDLLYYVIGRFGKDAFIIRWGKYIRVTEERVVSLEKFFFRHDWKIILIGKTQAIGSAILVAAGLAKMPIGRFIVYNIVGSAPKIALLMAIGFYFGNSFTKINKYVTDVAIISFVLALLFAGCYWWLKWYIKSKNRELNL